MDWIMGIQRAIDYTEAHLTDEIDYEMVAKEACSSVFHFQRMFHMLCGYFLGDYIRMRRLTLAAADLMRNDDKVIEIAFRYGYDTPESFSRAFSRFHGITPTEARRGKNVKSFSRLSVKLILSGGNTMDYRIEKKEAFQIVCKRKQVLKPQGDTATEDISAFWRECMADGTIPALCSYLPKQPTLKGILGICFTKDMADQGFPYGIGAEYNGEALHTEGLEVYPSADVQDPNYTCEIWIAVKEKN